MKRSGILFLWVILVIGLCCLAYAKPVNNSAGFERREIVEQHFNLGTDLYRRGDYAKAVEVFQIVLELDPGNEKARAYIAQARARLEEEKREKEAARQELKQRAEKELVCNIYKSGEYYIAKGEYKKAVKQFEKVLEIEPQNQKAKDGLMRALTELGEKKEEGRKAEVMALIDARTQQETIVSKELQAYLSEVYKQAEELFEEGELSEAKDMFEEIERIDPLYRDVENRLAGVRMILEIGKELEKVRKEGYEYALGPDDVVHLLVKDNPNLSGTITIQPAGELLLPEVNEIVMVNGLTKEQAKKKIENALSKYIKDVSVQLIIAGYNSKKWYVIGQVGRRGEFPMVKPNLTLMEALYRAGLPVEDTAAMKKVRLIKPHSTSPRQESIDVYALLYEGKMQNNVTIQPGDVIYVPKTALRRVQTLIGEVSAPVGATSTFLGDLEDVFTIVPITRTGSGAGQQKYKKYPWPWSQ